jgi:hypothetical protein
MPEYSGPWHPREAASIFRHVPGNYVLYDRWGRAYPGRQGPGVDRIGAHVRNYPGEYVEAYFMVDHQDDPCRRATREATAVTNLLDNGVRVRNRAWPSTPSACRR